MKCIYLLLFAVVMGCAQSTTENSISEATTREVLDHHWEAFKANDLEETMKDYTEESVLITPQATYRGLDQIRTNFLNAFQAFPRQSTDFTLDKSVVVSDVGYILWKSKTPTFNLTYASDTFIIRNGKIVRQTFAGVFE